MKNLEGYVYILTNPAFKDDFIKIGLTTRDVDLRADELYSTGVPLPFEIAYKRLTNNCHEAESKIHCAFGDERINQSREFFRLSPNQAKETVEAICGAVDHKYPRPDLAEVSRVPVDRVDEFDRIKSATMPSYRPTVNQQVKQKVEEIKRETSLSTPQTYTPEIRTSLPRDPLTLMGALKSFGRIFIFLAAANMIGMIGIGMIGWLLGNVTAWFICASLGGFLFYKMVTQNEH